jgi:hypothetical protein
MSTDRELLELAAKAAGLVLIRSRLDDPMWRDMLIDTRPEFPQTMGWNPLTDDGDALRLAVKLEFDMGQMLTPGMVTVTGVDDNGGCVAVDESYNIDPYAATRRAIVRAAAEIGKTMP